MNFAHESIFLGIFWERFLVANFDYFRVFTFFYNWYWTTTDFAQQILNYTIIELPWFGLAPFLYFSLNFPCLFLYICAFFACRLKGYLVHINPGLYSRLTSILSSLQTKFEIYQLLYKITIISTTSASGSVSLHIIKINNGCKPDLVPEWIHLTCMSI